MRQHRGYALGRRLTFVTNDTRANPMWLPAQWRECEGVAQRRHTTTHTKPRRDVEARACDTEHADDEARGYLSHSAQRGTRPRREVAWRTCEHERGVSGEQCGCTTAVRV